MSADKNNPGMKLDNYGSSTDPQVRKSNNYKNKSDPYQVGTVKGILTVVCICCQSTQNA